MTGLRSFAVSLAPVLVLIAMWEGVARSGLLTPFLLPAFSVVIGRIWEDLLSGSLASAMALTTARALSGFSIAAVLGVSLGIVMAVSGAMRWFFDPIVSVGFPTPKIAFLPIIVLWLGLNDASVVAITALSPFFIIAINSHAGASGVDKQLLWAARSLGSKPGELMREIILPAATPQILTGLQIALPTAMIATLVSEMLTGVGGLGGQLLDAQRYADSPGLFAGVVEIAFVGTVLIRGVAFGRRRLLCWHSEGRAGATA
ncbi:ABC transporter permease [Bosea sp. BH3]|uniref:ABC transporter permease n=1 Tax=Bosea sp. BH3 TaxID=2871701 RepID=UPI0021CB4F2A|nr:ABC transporter permease [Bosea sp. BH3]MCU4178344.1 ABC transporter permease [Bosea sp. BH3]